MNKCSATLFCDRQRLMERCRKNPGRYSRIDEGRWKDSEKNNDDIQGSLKYDEKMHVRFKSNCNDRRKMMMMER